MIDGKRGLLLDGKGQGVSPDETSGGIPGGGPNVERDLEVLGELGRTGDGDLFNDKVDIEIIECDVNAALNDYIEMRSQLA